MATHSSILAWKTPWAEEPGRLQSMGPEVKQYIRACIHIYFLELLKNYYKIWFIESPKIEEL